MAVNLDIKATTNNADIYAASLVVDVTVTTFVGTQVSPAKATLALTAGTPVVTGATKILSPTKATLAISAKTPTLIVTGGTQMAMII